VTTLTPREREVLGAIASAERSGGILVPFVSRTHRALEVAGLVTCTGELGWKRPRNVRVRCTAEGLEAARGES